MITRRDTLKFTMAALAGAAVLPLPAWAASKADSYKTERGEITIAPVQHASFVLTAPDGTVIYNDPVGGADLYKDFARPALILITHEHQDHFDPPTLAAIVGQDTRLIVNKAVYDKLPDDLRAGATALGYGDTMPVGQVSIEAMPAYNTTQDRLKYHPKGRDNGYVLTMDGKRVYIAGDTEDIPEMRALKDIFIAFLPMNLPYTMTTGQAADAVAAFKPEYVYPYHYRGTDPKEFADKVAAGAGATKVVMGPWYS